MCQRYLRTLTLAKMEVVGVHLVPNNLDHQTEWKIRKTEEIITWRSLRTRGGIHRFHFLHSGLEKWRKDVFGLAIAKNSPTRSKPPWGLQLQPANWLADLRQTHAAKKRSIMAIVSKQLADYQTKTHWLNRNRSHALWRYWRTKSQLTFTGMRWR